MKKVIKNYFLVLLKSATLFIAMAFAFSSCKKEKDDIINTTPAIEGKWVGKSGLGNSAPSTYYAFNIKTGGILERIDGNGNVFGEGTWALSGNVFSATYENIGTNAKFSIAATYYPATNNIQGQWGYNINTSDGGTFYLNKEN